MRRGGSVSFVVEVKRRRFPQQSATTSDLDRGSASRISPIVVGASSVPPLIEGKRDSDPMIDAAKIAAERFFSKPGSSHAVQADGWSDPTAGFISRVELARAADVAVQKPAAGLVASPPAQPAAQPDRPRSGRVLQNLFVEDPIDALLRREDEERSRHRPRGPRARSVIPDATRAAVSTGSGQILAHKMSAKRSSSFKESAVSRDIVEPGRRLRGRKVVTDPNPGVGTPRGKAVKKKGAKAPGRTGGLRRPGNEGAGVKQRTRKRAGTGSFDKKGIAKGAAAKKGAGKAAVAKKTTRKGKAKGSRGRPTLAKKRSVVRRIATKFATRKIGKTKRSAVTKAKASTRGPKAAKPRARRNR